LVLGAVGFADGADLGAGTWRPCGRSWSARRTPPSACTGRWRRGRWSQRRSRGARSRTGRSCGRSWRTRRPPWTDEPGGLPCTRWAPLQVGSPAARWAPLHPVGSPAGGLPCTRWAPLHPVGSPAGGLPCRWAPLHPVGSPAGGLPCTRWAPCRWAPLQRWAPLHPVGSPAGGLPCTRWAPLQVGSPAPGGLPCRWAPLHPVGSPAGGLPCTRNQGWYALAPPGSCPVRHRQAPTALPRPRLGGGGRVLLWWL